MKSTMTYIATGIIAITLGSAALAGDDYDDNAMKDERHSSSQQQDGMITAGDKEEETTTPEKLQGTIVIDSGNQIVGTVSDLVMDQSGHRMAVITLRESDKEVMLSLDDLTPASDGSLRSTVSAKNLSKRDEYSPMDTEMIQESGE